jgi:hypothetical protein
MDSQEKFLGQFSSELEAKNWGAELDGLSGAGLSQTEKEATAETRLLGEFGHGVVSAEPEILGLTLQLAKYTRMENIAVLSPEDQAHVDKRIHVLSNGIYFKDYMKYAN